MIDPTCWKLGTAAAILLSSIGVQAVYFDPQQNEYDAYCSAHASPAVGAICFDTSFDIRQHIVSSSPELVGFLSKDLRSKLQSRIANPVLPMRVDARTHADRVS